MAATSVASSTSSTATAGAGGAAAVFGQAVETARKQQTAGGSASAATAATPTRQADAIAKARQIETQAHTRLQANPQDPDRARLTQQVQAAWAVAKAAPTAPVQTAPAAPLAASQPSGARASTGQAASSSRDQIRLEKGDSLWSVSRGDAATIGMLAVANDLKGSTIRAGQILETIDMSRLSTAQRDDLAAYGEALIAQDNARLAAAGGKAQAAVKVGDAAGAANSVPDASKGQTKQAQTAPKSIAAPVLDSAADGVRRLQDYWSRIGGDALVADMNDPTKQASKLQDDIKSLQGLEADVEAKRAVATDRFLQKSGVGVEVKLENKFLEGKLDPPVLGTLNASARDGAKGVLETSLTGEAKAYYKRYTAAIADNKDFRALKMTAFADARVENSVNVGGVLLVDNYLSGEGDATGLLAKDVARTSVRAGVGVKTRRAKPFDEKSVYLELGYAPLEVDFAKSEMHLLEGKGLKLSLVGEYGPVAAKATVDVGEAASAGLYSLKLMHIRSQIDDKTAQLSTLQGGGDVDVTGAVPISP